MVVGGHACAAQNTSLGLSRLAIGDASQKPLSPSSYDVLQLSNHRGSHASEGIRNNARYLSIDAKAILTHPLNTDIGAGKVVFVSFSSYGSIGTIIAVGGARLGITSSDAIGFAQIMAPDSSSDGWRSLDFHVPIETYEGRALASLPVLTIRLDQAAGIFDVYSGTRLLADGLPLDANASRHFTLTAGADGAWLNGLVQADENPICEDTNRNGIDDRFEVQKRGQLLPTSATVGDRRQLAAEWREHQDNEPPAALFFNRPRPDRRPSATK